MNIANQAFGFQKFVWTRRKFCGKLSHRSQGLGKTL